MADTLTLLLAVMILVISLGLGVTLSFNDFQNSIKLPKALLTGFLSQFVFMPLVAFLFAKMFNFTNEVAIGLILVGSAPGGTTSNLFTYWCNGNVALSITMSVVSTLAAFFMLPLLTLLYIHGGGFTNDEIELDVTTMLLGLIIVIIPVISGAFLRQKNDECGCNCCCGDKSKLLCWQWTEKVGSAVGGLFLVMALIFGLVTNWEALTQSFSIWIVALLMQPLGCAFGFCVSKYAMKLDTRECCTISIETGVQNSSLIIAIVALSFPDEDQRDAVLVFPYLYSLCYIFNSAWITYYLRKLMAIDMASDGITNATSGEQGSKPAEVTQVSITSKASVELEDLRKKQMEQQINLSSAVQFQ